MSRIDRGMNARTSAETRIKLIVRINTEGTKKEKLFNTIVLISFMQQTLAVLKKKTKRKE